MVTAMRDDTREICRRLAILETGCGRIDRIEAGVALEQRSNVF